DYYCDSWDSSGSQF
nr:immunoglobulin light chain junction region [Macaca mulatta]